MLPRGQGAVVALHFKSEGILAPMSLIHDTLRAGHAPPAHRRAAGPRVLVAGGGGALGSALLEQLLGARHFAQVSVLVTQPVQAALRGLVSVMWGEAMPPNAALDRTAVVVFDRQRGVNGREDAFMRPQPEQLPALAAWLQSRGVRHLLVVMPHVQASLPDALKRGLASLDEHAVATLGFEHLVFMRSAQAPNHVHHAHPAQRLANWMLSQLQMMVPQRDRPVRVTKVAQFAAELAARLPSSPPGTRVVPPEVVWEAAQAKNIATLATGWLNGQPLPETPTQPSRM
jgi:nucleoside-diphosphate-sugar epimerase